MAGIGGKDTKPEILLRKALHARGYRYRLHVKELTGKPDLVLPRFRAVIFVHGCFWHQHPGCRFATMPSTRTEFWKDKFAANIRRDAASIAALREDAWRVAVIWECCLRGNQRILETVDIAENWIRSQHDFLEVGEVCHNKGSISS